MTKKVYFVTSNEKKYEEIQDMFDLDGFEVIRHDMDIPELQTEDEEQLVRNKVLTAFKEIRRPVIVEHTVLRINAFSELPGPQTRYFYSKLGYQNIVDFCMMKTNYGAEAKSYLGFCDGKKITIVHGEEQGEIVHDGRQKPEGFAWDEIFIPNENNPERKTYAEQEYEKNERSMRRKAWDNLKKELQGVDEKLFPEDEQDEIECLASLIREKKVMLFVGAGISASAKLPTWNELIKDLGIKKDIDNDLFKCYGDNMLLAEYADSDGSVFLDVKQKFDAEGNEEVKERLKNSEIYKRIYELDFPVIYTTNYDHLIEMYYDMQKKDKCMAIKQVSDMQKIKPGQTRIMKFHGDVDDEKSIVLSESQYFKRMDFQHFMDIQLQADMLRYHVLFLGYSMSDINIKLLLYMARKRGSMLGNDGDNYSYIFTATPNHVQKEVFRKNGIISISGDIKDKEKGTLDFLERLCQCVKN